jgi:hypothetical protein
MTTVVAALALAALVMPLLVRQRARVRQEADGRIRSDGRPTPLA